MNYRSEIDGLRALAVLPVILFHAGFTVFSGGFVGVDVFFVISGYLITSIILSEKEAGTFSIINFYERRARRIMPALFFVLLICIFFAWAWLLPSEMKDFSKSIRDVSIFMSNIFFYRQSGYFDTAAELKPLLHTWSLAVEEQYYLFFPLLIISLWKNGRKYTPYVLFAIMAMSLMYAQYKVGVNTNAAYFLLPSRLWELMIGSLLAYVVVNKHLNLRGNQYASIIGLTLILFAVFFFNRSTPFPSIYALLPTVGTALIIAYASPATYVGKLLSNKFFVNIGLISFSAYLWHQPIFAFARHRSLTEPSNWLLAMLTILAFVFAYFSWRFVEVPFRNKQYFNRKQIFYFTGLFSVFFLAFGLTGKATNGFEGRLPNEQLKLLSFEKYEFSSVYRLNVCFLDAKQNSAEFSKICDGNTKAKSTLIWGDSHAAALYFGLQLEMDNVMQYTASGCPPIKDILVSWRPNCREVNDFVMNKIQTLKPQNIFLHANWILYKEQDPIKSIKNTIDYIRQVSPNSVITIIGPVPQWKPSLPNFMLNRGLFLDEEQYFLNTGLNELMQIDKDFDKLAKTEEINFYSAISSFCSDYNCKITTSYSNEVMPTAWDYGHLTKAGSVLLARKLLANFGLLNSKIN